jgi:thiamine-monophosphate kinase
MAVQGPGVLQGIGDDCAILQSPGGGDDLLVSNDMFIENVHFTGSTLTAGEAGYRAIARALSDIAAMGGVPLWHLVSAAWGDRTGESWSREFFEGVREAGGKFGSTLVGGDTSRAPVFASDVTVIGSVPHGTALLRSGARPGDRIYVSGLLGGSEFGRIHGRSHPAAWERHVRPSPRIGLGQWLRGIASACMDLSDGLSLDLRRLCEASAVSAQIDALPCWPGVQREEAIHSGEDYELLFTAPPSVVIPETWEGLLPLTRIGEIQEGPAGEVLAYGESLPPLGYDHLERRRAPLNPDCGSVRD